MVKKAYLITLEAIIAIVILYIFMTYTISRNIEKPKTSSPSDIRLSQDTILSQIQTDDYYRNCALKEDYNCIDNMVSSSIKSGLSYNFTICHTKTCPVFLLEEAKDVYTRSLIISTNNTYYNVTQVTIHIWRTL